MWCVLVALEKYYRESEAGEGPGRLQSSLKELLSQFGPSFFSQAPLKRAVFADPLHP